MMTGRGMRSTKEIIVMLMCFHEDVFNKELKEAEKGWDGKRFPSITFILSHKSVCIHFMCVKRGVS